MTAGCFRPRPGVTAFVAAFVAILTPAMLAPIGPGWAQDDTIEVEVCNTFAQTVSVMIIHADPYQADQKLLRGWYPITGKRCQPVGSVPRGKFYVFGEMSDRKLEWSGTDIFACVARRPTERVLYDGQACLAGEESKGFFVQSADGEKASVRLE